LSYDKERLFDILLPHLAALKRCGRMLQLRAVAELQNGQSDKALAASNFRPWLPIGV
jgi:hypothetical protein